jgi:hypothetical protein
VAPVRLLLWRPIARTEVHQTVDMSDPSSVKVAFHLLHSVSAVLTSLTTASKIHQTSPSSAAVDPLAPVWAMPAEVAVALAGVC